MNPKNRMCWLRTCTRAAKVYVALDPTNPTKMTPLCHFHSDFAAIGVIPRSRSDQRAVERHRDHKVCWATHCKKPEYKDNLCKEHYTLAQRAGIASKAVLLPFSRLSRH